MITDLQALGLVVSSSATALVLSIGFFSRRILGSIDRLTDALVAAADCTTEAVNEQSHDVYAVLVDMSTTLDTIRDQEPDRG